MCSQVIDAVASTVFHRTKVTASEVKKEKSSEGPRVPSFNWKVGRNIHNNRKTKCFPWIKRFFVLRKILIDISVKINHSLSTLNHATMERLKVKSKLIVFGFLLGWSLFEEVLEQKLNICKQFICHI